MKNKITFFVLFFIFNSLYAQDELITNCRKTCERTQIVKEGATLGLMIVTLPNKNVKIVGVIPNSVASNSGFMVDDVITKLNGGIVQNQCEFLDSIRIHKPDDKVILTYERGGVEFSKEVILGALNTRVEKITYCCDDFDQRTLEQFLMLYPVPAKDEVTIACQAFSGQFTIELYNATGAFLRNFDCHTNQGKSKTIDLSRYQTGNYIVRVSNKGKTVVKEFILMRQ